MIDLSGKEVKDKNGNIFTVEAQDGELVLLSNGNMYKYSVMFKQGNFSVVDSNINDKVIEYVERIYIEQAEKDKELYIAEERNKELKRLSDIKNGEILGRNISYEHGNKLCIEPIYRYRRTYGTKAKDIYDDGCYVFGFKRSKSRNFAPQRLLYAEDCTNEGYSVWMLPYSDLNGQTNGEWANFIEKDKIIQYDLEGWGEASPAPRIVFAKQKNNEYVFIGVYRLTDRIIDYPRKGVAKETFSLVSKEYPEESE